MPLRATTARPARAFRRNRQRTEDGWSGEGPPAFASFSDERLRVPSENARQCPSQAGGTPVEQDERQRARQAAISAYRRDAEPVKAALAAVGIDTRDFGRFVSRPLPGVIDPARFDKTRAMPVLLEWLPRVSNERVRETMVRYLSVRAKDGAVADALIPEFRKPGGAEYKWVVADTLAFVCGPRHFAELTELAADKSYGHSRSPLVEMQWRIKTEAADRVLLDGIADPDVTFQAMSALRRRFGNPAARQHIQVLVDHANDRVRATAQMQLRRIDNYLAGKS